MTLKDIEETNGAKKMLNAPSILVIDDDEYILSMLKASLNQLGVSDIITESNSKRIFEILDDREKDFDIILLDLNMPDIDGLTILHHLARRNFEGNLILMSGEDRRILNAATTLSLAAKLKLIGAVAKPVTLSDLEKLLHKTQEMTSQDDTDGLHSEVSEDQLRQAILNNEIEVYYQPKVSAKDRKIIGAEALVRWISPSDGVIRPDHFIPVSEESGLVSDILYIVLERAICDLGKWQKQGYDLQVAVNLSVRSLDQVDLPDVILAMLQEEGLEPRQLILELTENQVMSEILGPLEVLCRLAMMGCRLSIDDFGTGYSSMLKLTTFPFHELKIDKAFVHDAGVDDIAHSILTTSSYLGHELDMKVTAEGVENEDDWEVAVAAGTDVIQGYLIAKPMPASEFAEFLAEYMPSGKALS